MHIKRVHPDQIRDQKCPHCSYQSGRQEMQLHIKAKHLKVKDYVCELCGYSTGSPGNFERHKKAVHLGVKSHMCSVCGYATHQLANLQKHVRTHHQGVSEEVSPN
jgi:KRAB domain-containing zinc finger protein